MDISVDIQTEISNVKSIRYVVHVPRGVKLLLAVYTPTIGFEGKEQFAVVDDGPAGQYQTDTVVQTTVTAVKVTTTNTWGTQIKSASGYNGQHLITAFNWQLLPLALP